MKKKISLFLLTFVVVTLLAINFKVVYKNQQNSSNTDNIGLITNANALADHSGLFYRGYDWPCAVEIYNGGETMGLGLGNIITCGFSFFSYCNASGGCVISTIVDTNDLN